MEENIKCGNSLISGVTDRDELEEYFREEIGELIALRKQHKSETDSEKKIWLSHTLFNKKRVINLKLNSKLSEYFDDVNAKKPFNWEIEFPEVFFNEDGSLKENPGFDCLVGNPPYVRATMGEERSYFQDSGVFAFVYGRFDIYVLSMIDRQGGRILNLASTRLKSQSGAQRNGTLATLKFKSKIPTNGKSANLSYGSPMEIATVKLVDSEGKLNKVSLKGKLSMESLLAPHQSALFQNYPNPFNPETWIPYQLSKEALVTIRIYSVTGQLVRAISLGSKPSGFYISRQRAAYWDGKNAAGEKVSSGVYFYNIQAGNFSATRKLLVLK